MTQTLPAGIDQRTAAAALWLHELFAETDGYVHVATSDPTAAEGPGWSPWRGIREAELGIPDDRPALLAGLAEKLVLESDLGVDVFACPYPLMGARVRAAGRATIRRHAHADIDGPVDLDAARALGAWAVASGSTAADGTAHGHVYVRMTESVPEHVHTALCRALGPMVGGEHHDRSKVNDNDVLRPPGTVNQKPGGGPVSWLIRPDDPAVRTWNPEALARLLGAGWPFPEPGGEPEARPAAAVAPSALGGAARRVDGLVRGVREAEHGDGNNALNHAAYVCGALYATAGEAEGLDAAEVREHLVRAYQERPTTEPAPKREREARATVRSGWESGAADPARALADRRPQQPAEAAEEHPTMTTIEPGATEEAATEEPLSKFFPLSWSKVLDGPPEPEDWLIWPLVERGKSVSLYSPAKAGKSLLVLELVAAAVAGKPVLGGPRRAPIRVLYLDQENTATDLRERLAAMGSEAADLDRLIYLSFPPIEPLTTARGGATLGTLAERFHPDLIVLDTVSRFIDGPENDSDTWHALELHSLRSLKRAGIAVLRLDHAGKDAERGERGSSAKNSDVDASWSLTHEERKGTRTLTRKITRNGHGPGSLLLSIQTDPLQHVPAGGTGEHPVDAAVRLLDELDAPESEGVNPAYERAKEAARAAGTKGLPREAVKAAQKRRQARGGDPA